MQYYRLWIYACNGVLLASVIAFFATLTTFVGDYRSELTNSFDLLQPCFVYGIVVLVVQGCGLTSFGCVAAHRLNARLLKIYWYLLLCLLGSDIIIGGTWMAAFEGLMSNLTDDIHFRHAKAYGNNSEYTAFWNQAQAQFRCCGVESAKDFKVTPWWKEHGESGQTVPESCCVPEASPSLTEDYADHGHGVGNPVTVYFQSSKQSRKAKQRKLNTNRKGKNRKPEKHDDNLAENMLKDNEEEMSSERQMDSMNEKLSSKRHGKPFRTGPPWSQGTARRNLKRACPYYSHRVGEIHHRGCAKELAGWLQQTAAILFVLNYCVLAFVKVCFLAILRHELKEMIKKIELLKTQDTAPLFPELAAALGVNKLSPQLARKIMGQTAETSDLKDYKGHPLANGSATLPETEPLLFANHVSHSRDHTTRKDELKCDKEQGVCESEVSSPIQKARSSLSSAIGQKGGGVFNNNDYFEMKELKGRDRHTEI